jgi:hypothetical protein
MTIGQDTAAAPARHPSVLLFGPSDTRRAPICAKRANRLEYAER